METQINEKRFPLFFVLKYSLFAGLLKLCLVFFIFNSAPLLLTQEQNEGHREGMFRDRALPNDSIPADAFKNAVNMQWQKRQSQGYSLPQPLEWISLGPTPVNPGPNSRTGRVVRVKYDPTDENIVYICGHNGGVWKSTNVQTPNPADVVFTPITDKDNILTQSSGDIAIDPQAHNTLYYGTGGNVYCFPYFNFYGIGVYKSTDGGNSWIGPYTNGLPSLIFTCVIAANPTNHDIYLANGWGTGPYGTGDGAGLYKSTDGGVDWIKVVPNDPSQSVSCYDVVFSNNGQNVYATTEGGYWRSINGGAFMLQNPGSTNFYPLTRTQISVSKANDSYVYAATRGETPHYIYTYISTDGGSTFSGPRQLDGSYGCMTYDFFFVQASPLNYETGFVGFGTATSSGLWRTTNAGLNYDYIPPNAADQNNFAFNPVDEDQGILCNDFGLWISYDLTHDYWDVHFSSLNNTLSFTECYRVASNPYDEKVMAIPVEDAGFFKYRPDLGEKKWVETNEGCDGTNLVHTRTCQPGFDVFIGSKAVQNQYCGSNMWASTDGGSSWPYNPYIPSGLFDGNQDWIAPIAEKPNAFGTFYHPRRDGGSYGGNQYININKSTDYGASWVSNPAITNITQINSGSTERSPQFISFCDANPQVIYVSTKWWLVSPSPLSQVFITIDGGQNWQNLQIENNGIPNKVVTSVVADPHNENVVYLTVSGFGSDHVFKSVNQGATWSSIDGSSSGLPDIPVNYLVIRDIDGPAKKLIVATDAGVYSTTDCEPPCSSQYEWNEVAEGLPNCVNLGLDYNMWSNKLRVASFGRGVWEVTYPDPIYVVGNKILSSTGQGINVANDIIVLSGGTLSIPCACTIKMPAGKKITIMDGGAIDASSGSQINFTSQSGEWNGIEFQGTAKGTLKNCYFYNAPVTITVNGGDRESQGINIDYCEIHDGSAVLNNASNVYFTNNKLYVDPNYITQNISGISINYGNNLNIYKNEIYGGINAIFAANASPSISQNTISTLGAGIGLYISYSADLRENNITSSISGVDMYSSSPKMYMNIIYDSGNEGLYARGLSYPILRPSDDGGGGLIWDAGLNKFTTTVTGLTVDASYADIYRGRNQITAPYRYILGGVPFEQPYFAQENCWDGGAPDPNKFEWYSGPVYWEPYECNPPEGAGKSGDNPTEAAQQAIAPPPPPIIVNHGHGCIDTIKVTTGSINLTPDKLLFSQGLKNELLGNYSNAINLYRSIVQNYQDSSASINSLKRIIVCFDKLNSDTAAYNILGQYYNNLAQNNQIDTQFYWTAKELAIKTDARKLEYPSAINRYEDVIAHTTDSVQIIASEINIISTYMLMSNGGDVSYTGRLKQLKPISNLEGFKMIMDRLGYHRSKLNSEIPKEFKLSQNYPNPFNPLTKINYAIPKKTNVTLKVYDILGRLVKTLVNEFKEAGYYTVQFDGSALASGVYFYKIEAGDFVQSKKMVLIK